MLGGTPYYYCQWKFLFPDRDMSLLFQETRSITVTRRKDIDPSPEDRPGQSQEVINFKAWGSPYYYRQWKLCFPIWIWCCFSGKTLVTTRSTTSLSGEHLRDSRLLVLLWKTMDATTGVPGSTLSSPTAGECLRSAVVDMLSACPKR
jgi:hypothetical protein